MRDENLNGINVFGYPISVIEQYELDIKDIWILHRINENVYSLTLHHKQINNEVFRNLNHKLFVSDYPIVYESESSLRNHIYTLLEKGLIQRHMEYSNDVKIKRCYYRIHNENLWQSLSIQTLQKYLKKQSEPCSETSSNTFVIVYFS